MQRAATAKGGGRCQRGQAMVEYAILLVLLVTLVIGGIELAIAAYTGHSTGRAASAAVGEWLGRALRFSKVDASGNQVIDNVASGGIAGLGDHDPTRFVNAACVVGAGGLGYDDGLPADSVSKGGDRLYLYNPLPLEVTACIGQTDADCAVAGTTRTAEAALIEGNTDCGGTYAGLPRMHAAMRPLYRKECTTAGLAVKDCTRLDLAAGDRVFLRLPGGVHGGGDPRLETYLAMTDAGGGILHDGGGNPVTRPALALHCDAPGSTSGFPGKEAAGNCVSACYVGGTYPAGPAAGLGLACNVRVLLRTRHIFESFLLMDSWKSPVPVGDRAVLDNPFDASGQPVKGIIGAELTRGFVRKTWKTFQGCAHSEAYFNATVATGSPSFAGGDVASCN